LLKYWPKTGTEADNELREIWRHERLQVDRIMSYPGAEDLFAGVVAETPSAGRRFTCRSPAYRN